MPRNSAASAYPAPVAGSSRGMTSASPTSPTRIPGATTRYPERDRFQPHLLDRERRARLGTDHQVEVARIEEAHEQYRIRLGGRATPDLRGRSRPGAATAAFTADAARPIPPGDIPVEPPSRIAWVPWATAAFAVSRGRLAGGLLGVDESEVDRPARSCSVRYRSTRPRTGRHRNATARNARSATVIAALLSSARNAAVRAGAGWRARTSRPLQRPRVGR